MSNIREVIIEIIKSTLSDSDVSLTSELTNDSVLLECGLDSLGFAIVVAELESELGFDPFVIMESPVYPKTLLDFINIYEAQGKGLK